MNEVIKKLLEELDIEPFENFKFGTKKYYFKKDGTLIDCETGEDVTDTVLCDQTYTIIETNSANADTTSYTAKNKEAAQSKFEEIRQHYLDKCSSDGDIDHDYIEIDDTDMFMIYDESIDADRVVQIVSSQKV